MLTSGKTPFAVGGETAIRRVGRVAECTSPLTRQAVRLRRFESSTLRNFISGYGTDYYRKPRCIGHTRKKCREYRDRGYNLRHRTAVFPVRGEYPQTDKGSGKRLNDSIWATVLGIARTLGVTEKYALYDISYVNAIMYSRAMPMPGDKGENGNAPLYDGSKDANDPENFKDFTDDDEVVRI